MLLYCSDFTITTHGEMRKVKHLKQVCNFYSMYFGLPSLSWWVLSEVNYDSLLPYSYLNIFFVLPFTPLTITT